METIIILFIIFVVIVSLNHKSNTIREELEEEIDFLRNEHLRLGKVVNGNTMSSIEAFQAFKDLADRLGYSVHEEYDVNFDIESIIGNKKPVWASKGFVIQKKEPTAPVKKLKVKSKK